MQEDLPATLVLDTNVVLALWLFRDDRLRALLQALEQGRARWCLTPPMRDELVHEFEPARCVRYGVARDDVLPQVLARGQLRPPPPAVPLPAGARCSDSADQMFIDLAIALATNGPCTLLSRDRAVLRLARRVRPLGVTIDSPERWPATVA